MSLSRACWGLFTMVMISWIELTSGLEIRWGVHCWWQGPGKTCDILSLLNHPPQSMGLVAKRNHQQMSREQVNTCHNGQPRLYICLHVPNTNSTVNLVPTHISSILFLTTGYFINLLRLHLRQLYSVCLFSFYFAKCKIDFFSEYRNTLWKFGWVL